MATRSEARALIEKAWRTRGEAVQSPPGDAAGAEAVAARVEAVATRVEADLVRACEICERIGAMRELSIALGKLAHVALDRGQADKARSLLEDAVAAARAVGDPLRVAHAVRHLGQVHHRQGRWDQAESCYREALDLYGEANGASPLDHANALRPMAMLLEDRGDVEEAVGVWGEAARLYRMAGVTAGVEECEARMEELEDIDDLKRIRHESTRPLADVIRELQLDGTL